MAFEASASWLASLDTRLHKCAPVQAAQAPGEALLALPCAAVSKIHCLPRNRVAEPALKGRADAGSACR